MREYVSEAVVLRREPSGDLDGRISLFTKKFGKLTGKGKSIRKITSKLSGHLDVGNLLQARLVEKNGLQIVDALKQSRLALSPWDLYALEMLLAEAEPDEGLWHLLVHGRFSWPPVLKMLGWDPAHGSCAVCGKTPIHCFAIRGQEFFCNECLPLKVSRNELLYIRITSP